MGNHCWRNMACIWMCQNAVSAAFLHNYDPYLFFLKNHDSKNKQKFSWGFKNASVHIQHPGQVFPPLALAPPRQEKSSSGGSAESPPALSTLGSAEQTTAENFPQTFLLKDLRSGCHRCVSHLSKPRSFFSSVPFSAVCFSALPAVRCQ